MEETTGGKSMSFEAIEYGSVNSWMEKIKTRNVRTGKRK